MERMPLQKSRMKTAKSKQAADSQNSSSSDSNVMRQTRSQRRNANSGTSKKKMPLYPRTKDDGGSENDHQQPLFASDDSDSEGKPKQTRSRKSRSRHGGGPKAKRQRVVSAQYVNDDDNGSVGIISPPGHSSVEVISSPDHGSNSMEIITPPPRQGSTGVSAAEDGDVKGKGKAVHFVENIEQPQVQGDRLSP